MKYKDFLKKFLILSFLLFIFTLTCAYSYANTISANLANNIFRLHIIANSDDVSDQDLKLKVRDAVLEYMNNNTDDSFSKEQIIKFAQEHKIDFANISKKIIMENGYSYDVSVSVCNSFFPTKNYGDISFPAGYYDCLKIEIGESAGKNWWCVMFPPLCFVDVSSGIVPDSSKESLEQSLSTEEYSIISSSYSENESIALKFKIVEIFQDVKKLAKGL